MTSPLIPAKTGIQNWLRPDPGFRRMSGSSDRENN